MLDQTDNETITARTDAFNAEVNPLIEEPKKTRKPRNGNAKPSTAKPKSTTAYFVLTTDGKYREFSEDDMLAEAAEAWGKPEIRIIKAEVLNFEIVQK